MKKENEYLKEASKSISLRKFNQAIEFLNKAIELNPNYIQAYFNRGETYSKIKDYDKAINDYTKVLKLNPDHNRANYLRGLIYSENHHSIKRIFFSKQEISKLYL